MNVVPSKMIDVSLDKKSPKVHLDELVKMYAACESIPITMFGDSISEALLEEAISYLLKIGGGSVSVPKTDKAGYLKVHVRKDKLGNFGTKFEYYSYRYPIGTEARPYTGGEWEIGDIVYNADISNSDEKCFGWVCMSQGIPGKWLGFLTQEMRYDEEREALVFGKTQIP